MSYDVTNYAMRAVSVPDILNAIKPGVSFPIMDAGIYVIIDEKFSKLCELHMPKCIREPEEGFVKHISDNKSYITSEYITELAAPLAFSAVIASACGICDPAFYSTDKRDLNLPMSLKGEMKIYPCMMIGFTLNEVALNDTVVFVPERTVLKCMASFLGKKNMLTVVPCDYHTNKPLKVSCLKTSLENLFRAHQNSGVDHYALEDWMAFLVMGFLQSNNCYIHIGAVSTYHGDVLDYGGMKEHIPYISIGDLEEYNEDGWYDPKEKMRWVVKEFKSILIGKKSKIVFDTFTPQFGG